MVPVLFFEEFGPILAAQNVGRPLQARPHLLELARKVLQLRLRLRGAQRDLRRRGSPLFGSVLALLDESDELIDGNLAGAVSI